MFLFPLFYTSLFVLLLLLLVVFVFFASARASKAFFLTSSIATFSFSAFCDCSRVLALNSASASDSFYQILPITLRLVFALLFCIA